LERAMSTIPSQIPELSFRLAERKAEIVRLEQATLNDERLRNLEAALSRRRAEHKPSRRVMIGSVVLVALAALIVLLLSLLLS